MHKITFVVFAYHKFGYSNVHKVDVQLKNLRKFHFRLPSVILGHICSEYCISIFNNTF